MVECGKIERCWEYETLTRIWFEAVKVTHDFLSREDIDFYRARIPHDYMLNVELYALRDEVGNLCAFIGLSAGMIEMLFVHPRVMGKGYGSALLLFAVRDKGVRKVDVNEQNCRALEFYQRHGFAVVGRDDIDSEGKPSPILHLELETL